MQLFLFISSAESALDLSLIFVFFCVCTRLFTVEFELVCCSEFRVMLASWGSSRPSSQRLVLARLCLCGSCVGTLWIASAPKHAGPCYPAIHLCYWFFSLFVEFHLSSTFLWSDGEGVGEREEGQAEGRAEIWELQGGLQRVGGVRGWGALSPDHG